MIKDKVPAARFKAAFDQSSTFIADVSGCFLWGSSFFPSELKVPGRTLYHRLNIFDRKYRPSGCEWDRPEDEDR